MLPRQTLHVPENKIEQVSAGDGIQTLINVHQGRLTTVVLKTRVGKGQRCLEWGDAVQQVFLIGIGGRRVCIAIGGGSGPGNLARTIDSDATIIDISAGIGLEPSPRRLRSSGRSYSCKAGHK